MGFHISVIAMDTQFTDDTVDSLSVRLHCGKFEYVREAALSDSMSHEWDDNGGYADILFLDKGTVIFHEIGILNFENARFVSANSRSVFVLEEDVSCSEMIRYYENCELCLSWDSFDGSEPTLRGKQPLIIEPHPSFEAFRDGGEIIRQITSIDVFNLPENTPVRRYRLTGRKVRKNKSDISFAAAAGRRISEESEAELPLITIDTPKRDDRISPHTEKKPIGFYLFLLSLAPFFLLSIFRLIY